MAGEPILMSRPELLQQLVRYGLAGLMNTGLGLGVILVLQELAGLPPYAANAAGFAAGLLLGFLLHRSWTFRVLDRSGARFVRFVVAFAIAYGVNLVTLALLIAALGAPAAQVAGVAAYAIVFFALCRVAVFAPRPGARLRDGFSGSTSSPPKVRQHDSSA